MPASLASLTPQPNLYARNGLLRILLATLGLAVFALTSPTARAAESVDYKVLKALVPEELVGLKRTDLSGERSKLDTLSITTVTGNFKKGEDEAEVSIDLSIVEYAGPEDMVAAMAAWTQINIDQDGDKGYTRSEKLGDYKALETYEKAGKSGSIMILLAPGRWVELKTHNVPADQIKKAAEALPLKKLAEAK